VSADKIPCNIVGYALDFINRRRYGLKCISNGMKELIRGYVNYLDCPGYEHTVDCAPSRCLKNKPPVRTYWNTEQCGEVNCDIICLPGFRPQNPGTHKICVAANTYSSTASVQDANNMALQQLKHLMDTYTGCGTCVPLNQFCNIQLFAKVTSTEPCPPNHHRTEGEVTVPAGKYCVSEPQTQLDADNLAQNDLNINKQAIINGINVPGSEVIITIPSECTENNKYCNVERSDEFTRECLPGFDGSTVKIIVPPNTFCSYVSQLDANNQADTWIRDNGQDIVDGTYTGETYGNNTEGICTPKSIPPVFTITPNSVTHVSTGEQTVHNIQSQIQGASENWDRLVMPNWISGIIATGADNANITATSSANNTGSQRTAVINFRQQSSLEIRPLTIIQPSNTFILETLSEDLKWTSCQSIGNQICTVSVISEVNGVFARVRIDRIGLSRRPGSSAWDTGNLTSGWTNVSSGIYDGQGIDVVSATAGVGNLTSQSQGWWNITGGGTIATIPVRPYANQGNYQFRHHMQISSGYQSGSTWVPTGLTKEFYMYQHANWDSPFLEIVKSGGKGFVTGVNHGEQRRVVQQDGLIGNYPAKFDISEIDTDEIVVFGLRVTNVPGGESQIRLPSQGSQGLQPPSGMSTLTWRITCRANPSHYLNNVTRQPGAGLFVNEGYQNWITPNGQAPWVATAEWS
jgi:hypothetical protein